MPGFDYSQTPAGGGVGALLYKYVCTGSKTSIDTNVDGALAGPLSQAYNVLELFLLLRTDEAVGDSRVNLTLNGDTSGNYDPQYVSGAGTSASAGVNSALPGLNLQAAGSSNAANRFDVSWMTIPFYTQTDALKLIAGHEGHVDTTNANNWNGPWTCVWRSQAAVTRIAVQPHTAGRSLVLGSSMLVYGR